MSRFAAQDALFENHFVVDRLFPSAVDFEAVLLDGQGLSGAMTVLVEDVHRGDGPAAGDAGLHGL